MAVPDEQDFMLPILRILGDGNEHSTQEFYEVLAQEFRLTEADRKERNKSDTDWLFNNRVRWAYLILKKADLLSCPKRSRFCITERGINVIWLGSCCLANL